MTRAVIYARYSSENQRDESIEDQTHRCAAGLARLEASLRSIRFSKTLRIR
jgi:hypothetical protein